MSRDTDENTGERRKVTLLENRCEQLAANLQGLIVFKDEYKSLNSRLLEENTRLRTENETMFSQKLQDKETLTRQLQQDIRQNEEKHNAVANDFREREADLQSKLLKQSSQKETLLKRLDDTQHSLRAAEDACQDLKHQLQQAGEGRVSQETQMKQMMKSLSVERDTFMNLSMERGEVIQEKQEHIQQLERKLEQVEEVKTKAEDRFRQEAEAVNVNMKVATLQSALEQAAEDNETARQNFEAYREHSGNLLAQEKKLTARLQLLSY